jgi:hypothetical protein
MFAAKNHAKRSCRYRVRGVANLGTLTQHATTPFDFHIDTHIPPPPSPIRPFLSSKDRIATQFFPRSSHCDALRLHWRIVCWNARQRTSTSDNEFGKLRSRVSVFLALPRPPIITRPPILTPPPNLKRIIMHMFPLPPKPKGVITPEFLNVLKNISESKSLHSLSYITRH